MFMPNSSKTHERFYIELSIHLIKINGKPGIQLKKTLSNKEAIQIVCHRALENDYIPARIIFRDKLLAASKLKSQGLL